MTQSLSLKLKIYPNSEEQEKLFQMSEQYRLACNFVSKIYFDSHFSLSKRKLHDKCYRFIRSDFGLKAQQAQSVIRTVLTRYKSIKTQMSQEPAKVYDKYTKTKYYYYKTLEHLQKPVYFKNLQSDLVYNKDFRFNSKGLKITTLDNLVTVDFDIHYFEKYLVGDYKIGTAKLVYKKYNNTWYLHISLTKDYVDFDSENVSHVVGIDLGIINTAVSHDSNGKTLFFKGRKNRAVRNNYKRLRAELQSKNTKSSKRRLSKIENRENRWMNDINHKITKTLVNTYGPNTLFVLEDLESISKDLDSSKKHNGKMTSWAFYQFRMNLEYKANLIGAKVLVVDAHYTSQRCPKCGTIDKKNRDSKNSHYHCHTCGYQSNDDRIGAMNLLELGNLYLKGIKKPKFKKPNTR